jgi:peptidyl-prolyl cis-trans isomerase B (cyclophilin B)
VAPPKRSNRRLIIGLAVAAAVLLCACLPAGGLTAYLLARDDDGSSPIVEPGVPVPSATASSSSNASSGAGGPGGRQCRWEKGPVTADTKDVGTPPVSVPATGRSTMTIVTDLGTIRIELNRAATPCTVASFTHLAGKGYFDGTSCHRLTTDGIFVVQCGDPSGTGRGGPSYRFPDENLPAVVTPYPRGNVAMANAGPGTNGSQFFLTYKDSPLPKDYTQFGTIVSGLEIVDRVADGGVDPAGANGAGDGKPKAPLKFTSVTVA